MGGGRLDPGGKNRIRRVARRCAWATIAVASALPASCGRTEETAGRAVERLHRLAFLPAGSFAAGPEEGPREEALERAVLIERFEVTNAEYAEFVRATRYRGEGKGFLLHFGGADSPPPGLEEMPVVFVSRADAEAFADWRGMRLPRGVEWERAARGVRGSGYPWGNSPQPLVANTWELGLFSPVRVGTFESGKSPSTHCYDLAGNVWEWTAEPPGEIRGGSFWSRMRESRAAYPWSVHPRIRWSDLGFRCAADAEQELRRALGDLSRTGDRDRRHLLAIAARYGPQSGSLFRELAAQRGFDAALLREMAEHAESALPGGPR